MIYYALGGLVVLAAAGRLIVWSRRRTTDSVSERLLARLRSIDQ
jgi:hypothetical protein